MAANCITHSALYSWPRHAYDCGVPGRTYFNPNARADCDTCTDSSLRRASGMVSLHCAFR